MIASKYGEHAFDQWSVDEVLSLAKDAGSTSSAAPAAPEAPVEPQQTPAQPQS